MGWNLKGLSIFFKDEVLYTKCGTVVQDAFFLILSLPLISADEYG